MAPSTAAWATLILTKKRPRHSSYLSRNGRKFLTEQQLRDERWDNQQRQSSCRFDSRSENQRLF
jgi:hypothetical protein